VLIARMLVVGRDSLMKLQEQVSVLLVCVECAFVRHVMELTQLSVLPLLQLDAAEAKLVEHIDKTRPRS
jgi:hypothetical protein